MSEEAKTARPDKAAILSGLKGFQQRTVEHVVARLLSPDGSRRFLVADEVGLGKTLIARGVVAEVVDRLWERVERIDILYVCSNQALARDNLSKIRIGGHPVKGTRLTLLPRELPSFDNKLNFVSLTPGTALTLTGYGKVDEREVLYALLSKRYDERAWLRNLLRGDVAPENWRRRLSSLPDVHEKLSEAFLKRLAKDRSLLAALKWAESTLTRVDARLDEEQKSKRYRTVEELRKLLARTCIDALQPDLIILDEFQRFKELLTTGAEAQSEETELIDTLLNYETPEGSQVATLLLSATPYRMFVTDAEARQGEHYSDFESTLEFLCGGKDRAAALLASRKRYQQALYDAITGDRTQIQAARAEFQTLLKDVMVRTERVDSTEERDAMVEEVAVRVPVTQRDLAHYLATEQLAEACGSGDMVEFWKSAPYLFNFMKKYQAKEAFETQLHLKAVRQGFLAAQGEFLSPEQIERYQAVDPANARLRALSEQALGAEQWRMLWLPPTVPYWPLSEPWSKNRDFSKKLVFSAWNVVPDAISALLSYDAERRMAGESGHDYSKLYRTQRPLLRYVAKGGQPQNMSTLLLSLPCLTLADEISPIELALTGRPIQESVRELASQLVQRLEPFAGEGEPDPQWHWAALLLLDSEDPSLAEHLEEWDPETDPHDDDDSDASEDQDEQRGQAGFNAHLERAKAVVNRNLRLGAIPSTLVDTLVDVALGSPAVLAARSLAFAGANKLARRQAAVRVANGFRTLFNQPFVIRMLKAAGDDESYWRETLHYAFKGNLQAVLDEQVHLLWEQEAWSGATPDENCLSVAQDVSASVTTKVSRISPDVYAATDGKIREALLVNEQGKRERISLRTSFALRYGSVTGASGATEAREDSVRAAFRSPFFPFVLVSTSVGQEGLDFHPWCHEIWHWNLPGNPVDLEQREGRVHRYKGLAVRRNIAQGAMETLKLRWKRGDDPWRVLFDAAAERHRDLGSELIPHWLAPGPYKVRRCVPLLPFSSEIEQFRRLKRSLALYRVVFGQPRQEELLTLLDEAKVPPEELENWTISLRP